MTQAGRAEFFRSERFAARVFGALALLVWSSAWFTFAVSQYREQRVCDLVAGPFLPCGPHEWREPLLLAAGPPLLMLALALLVAVASRAHRT